MSEFFQAQPTFRERIAGKWQIPALFMSLAVMGLVISLIKPADRKFTIEQNLERVQRLIDQGVYAPAIELGERLKSWEDIDDTSRALLSLLLARAGHEQALSNKAMNEDVANKTIDLYETAIKAEVSLTAKDYVRIAECCEILGQAQAAVNNYQRAVSRTDGAALAQRRRIIELSEYPLRVDREEISAMLDSFIEDSTESPTEMVWALSHRLEGLYEEQKYEEAEELLDRYADLFMGTSLESEYEYLSALNLWGEKRYDEAERLLRELRNRLTVIDPVYPKAGWLLAKVVLYDGKAQRPQEALSLFRDVISSRADFLYGVASRVGTAEALAELHRYEDSLNAYSEAISDMRRLPSNKLVNRDVVRASLAVVGQRLRQEGELELALAFAEKAMSLVNTEDVDLASKFIRTVAELRAAVAREYLERANSLEGEEKEAEATSLVEDAKKLFVMSGDDYVHLARLNTLNEELASLYMWTAATIFDEGDHHDRAIDVLKTFVEERPEAEMAPRVMLRLGRSLQAAGRYEEAVEVYQRNCSLFPRSPFANASLIPLAECLMAMGPEHSSQAEQALRSIIDDSEMFTPEAMEYRAALFLLGSLHAREGRYEEAIPILTEATERYPDDRRRLQAEFLLANSYAQSALRIKEVDIPDPNRVGDIKHLRVELHRRLEESLVRFHRMVEMIEEREVGDVSELEQVYLRDARFNEADCLFRLQRYSEALSLYERAAWIYKDSPVALDAYVQIINCHYLLGQQSDAMTALRRAQYLVGAITDEEFEKAGTSQTRDDWRRYFEGVNEILLEGGVLTAK